MAHVQVMSDSVACTWTAEKCPVPRRSNRSVEAQDGSGRVCGSGQSVVGLSTPAKEKLGLKEEVIDHFREGRGRKVEASWRRGHLTRSPCTQLLAHLTPLLGIGTPSHPGKSSLGRLA